MERTEVKVIGLYFNVCACGVPLGDPTPRDECCHMDDVPFFEVGFFLSPHLLLIFFLSSCCQLPSWAIKAIGRQWVNGQNIDFEEWFV
jgi:hypothetical protein